MYHYSLVVYRNIHGRYRITNYPRVLGIRIEVIHQSVRYRYESLFKEDVFILSKSRTPFYLIKVLPEFIPKPSLLLYNYTYNRKTKRYEECYYNIMQSQSIGFCFVFNQNQELYYFPQYMEWKRPNSCLLPQTEFLFKIFRTEEYLQP